jgi:hypothetical protein
VSAAVVGVLFVNVAVAARALESLTVQVTRFPLQAPPQPRNAWPAPGLAVSVALAPALKCWTQVFAGPVDAHAPADVDTAPRPTTLIVSVPGVPADVNVADTLRAAVMLTVHFGVVPEHEPPQPPKVAALPGVAVSVTVVPELKVALHVVPPLPQLIEAPVTRPGPETETLSGNVPAAPPLKLAVTDFDASNVTVHVIAVPVHAPLQPVKVAPPVGVAVRVAVDPATWFGLLQVVAPPPQLIPPPVTVPFPATATLSVKPVPLVPPLKVAVTLLAELMSTKQVVDVPLQAPPHPTKVDPVAAVAVRVTDVFWVKAAPQMVAPLPQLMAPEPAVTVPFPVTLTDRSGEKVAVTLLSASIVTVHVEPTPSHPPPVQPVKT